MRKVYIISRYFGKVNRGVETYVGELSIRLAKNCQIEILTNPYPLLFKPFGSVVICTNGRLDSVMSRLITWIKGQKLIISGQSGLGFDDKLNLLCFPDRFIALTEHQKNWAHQFNPFVNMEVIPNGVDLIRYTPSKTKPRIPTVGYVAALYPEKRQELLIRAVAQTSANLLLVGKGPEEERLTALCQKLLPNRYQITSYPNDLMPEAYSLMSIFAYPTVPWESFGIAMIEAMAANLPVVATNDPIRREIVGKAGLFASPENLSEKIKEALKKNWGSLPRHRAEKFSWDKIADQYHKLIQEL